MTTTTATAVMNYGTMVVGERPRRSQEELVDRVMDALFASNHQQPQETVARRVHNDGPEGGGPRWSAGGVRQRRTGHDCPKRGAMGLRRVAEPGAQDVRRPRAPGLQPGHRQSCGAGCGDGTVKVLAVLGMGWQPGKVVSARSLRGLKPLKGGGSWS